MWMVCLVCVWEGGGVRVLFRDLPPLPLLSFSHRLLDSFKSGRGAFAWETKSAVKVESEKRPEAHAVGRNAAAARAGGAGGGKGGAASGRGRERPPMTLNADPASGELGGEPTQSGGEELR